MNKDKMKKIITNGIKALEVQIDIDEKIDKAFDSLFDGFPVFTATTDLEEAFISTLAELFNSPADVKEYIYWYLYDGYNSIYINGKEVPIRCAEDLFDNVIGEYYYE